MNETSHYLPSLAMLSPWVLVAVLFVIVLLFGGSKLPELAKGVGKSIKEFKKAASEDDDDEEEKKASEKKAEKKAIESDDQKDKE